MHRAKVPVPERRVSAEDRRTTECLIGGRSGTMAPTRKDRTPSLSPRPSFHCQIKGMVVRDKGAAAGSLSNQERLVWWRGGGAAGFLFNLGVSGGLAESVKKLEKWPKRMGKWVYGPKKRAFSSPNPGGAPPMAQRKFLRHRRNYDKKSGLG